MATFLIISTLFLAVTELSEAGYCYANNEETYSYRGSTNDPTKWPAFFPTCNGNMQSPVAIKNVIKNPFLAQLSFTGYEIPLTHATVVNDGHTVMIEPQDNVKRGITVLGIDYNLQQLHFHWGSEKNPGGEHTLNGQRFEMEVHFVHTSIYKTNAVVGVLVQVANRENKAYRKIVKILPSVQYKDDTTQLTSSLYLNQILPEIPASYYGYTGSLTTPMCTEGVAWFVLQKKQTIGWKQLDAFLNVSSVEKEDRRRECLLAPNNRPLQNLNGRVITASK